MAYKRFTNNIDKLYYSDKGAFDIPRLAPFIMGKIPDKYVGFNEVNSFKAERYLTGVYFFIYDYLVKLIIVVKKLYMTAVLK